MINQQNPKSQNLKLLQLVLSRKFVIKGQRLKDEVLSLIKDKNITLQLLEQASSQSQKLYGSDSPYIQILFNKSTDPSPEKIKQQIIASALFPFDEQPYFYPQNLYKTSKRIGIQLFYSLAYQHPCAAIKLRSYIDQFYNSQQITQHPIYQIVTSVECDFYPHSSCKVIKIHLDSKQLSKQNAENDNQSQVSGISQQNSSMSQQSSSLKQKYRVNEKVERQNMMIVERDDQYLSSSADYEKTNKQYNQIMKKIQKAGILKIGQKQIIVKVKDYKILTKMPN